MSRHFLALILLALCSLHQAAWTGGSTVPVGTYLYSNPPNKDALKGNLTVEFSEPGEKMVIAYGRRYRKDRKDRTGTTEAQRELFSQLGEGQAPHTLFIGCSDSRVVPTLITRTRPGELFLVRNVANIVPPYGSWAAEGSTAAAIEYAVLALGVDAIVVCGHSNCGGCAALNQAPHELAHLPLTTRWLELAAEVKPRVAKLRKSDDPAERVWLTEHVNVLVQMKHLLTYPFVAERVAEGRLSILGWYYVIATGEVLNFNDSTGHFEKVV